MIIIFCSTRALKNILTSPEWKKAIRDIKSKKCYCTEGFEKCDTIKGITCCNLEYESCKGIKLPFGANKQHCEANEGCNKEKGKKKCQGDETATCCDINDICATVKIWVPFLNDYKKVAICQPKGCKVDDPKHCSKDENGLDYCCNDLKTDCKPLPDPDKPENIVKVCMPNKANCDALSKEFCPGTLTACCPAGKCQLDPAGKAYCSN